MAVRSGQFAIASLLVEHGADVDDTDTDSASGWSAPVLQDAVAAAVMRSRWLRPKDRWVAPLQWHLALSKEQSDDAFAVLQLLLEKGADVDVLDSYGNSTLARAVVTARQILPQHRYNEPDWVDPKPLNDELVQDLDRIFCALYAHGADPSKVDPHLGHPLDTFYGAEPVGRFLKLS